MTTEQRDGGIAAPHGAEPAGGKMRELGVGTAEGRRDPLGILQLQETERTDVFGIPHGAEARRSDEEASGRRSRGTSLARGEAPCEGREERRRHSRLAPFFCGERLHAIGGRADGPPASAGLSVNC